VSFASFDAPGAIWGGTQLKVSWTLSPVNGCSPVGHVKMTEGGKVLYDAAMQVPSGSATITPQDLGKVQVTAWASCSGAPNTTVTAQKTVEVDTALGPPTCSGGGYAQYYTFCLSAPDQTTPPQCYKQSTTIVLACTEANAKSVAQAMATNWKIADGACPSSCE
jgi:hypothetical protein